MTVDLCGANKNDLLIGVTPETLDAKIFILNGIIPASSISKTLDRPIDVKDLDTLYNTYITIVDFGNERNMFHSRLSVQDRFNIKHMEPSHGWTWAEIRQFFVTNINDDLSSAQDAQTFIFKKRYWQVADGQPLHKYDDLLHKSSHRQGRLILSMGNGALNLYEPADNDGTAVVVKRSLHKSIIDIPPIAFLEYNKSGGSALEKPSQFPEEHEFDHLCSQIAKYMPLKKIYKLFDYFDDVIVYDDNNYHVTTATGRDYIQTILAYVTDRFDNAIPYTFHLLMGIQNHYGKNNVTLILLILIILIKRKITRHVSRLISLILADNNCVVSADMCQRLYDMQLYLMSINGWHCHYISDERSLSNINTSSCHAKTIVNLNSIMTHSGMTTDSDHWLATTASSYMEHVIHFDDHLSHAGDLQPVNITLPDSFLSRAIGLIDVKMPNSVNGTVISVIITHDHNDFIYINKRDITMNISADDKAYCMRNAIDRLTAGIAIVDGPIADKTLYLTNDGEYYVDDIPWDIAKTYTISLPTNIIRYGNDDGHLLSLSIINHIVEQQPLPQDIIYLINILKSNIMVVSDDDPIYRYILSIAKTFPHVIIKNTMESFTVTDYNILYYIINILTTYVRSLIPSADPWHDLEAAIDHRCNYRYQSAIISKLIDERRRHQYGHFIWLTVGMGKTKIVLEYLKWLNTSGHMAPYIIYTCPSDAVDVVINEISTYYQIPTHKVCPGNSSEYKRYVINIVEHDHIGNLDIDVAANSIFLVDEVHQTFISTTKRAKKILDIARRCREFIIFTGTPIVDGLSLYRLQDWLRLIVDFPITRNNVATVALSMMTSKYTNTTIINRYRLHLDATVDPYSAIIDDVIWLVKTAGRRVMVVVKTLADARLVHNALLSAGISSHHMTTGINLSRANVSAGKHIPYDVVVTTIRQRHGYSLTWLNVMVSLNYTAGRDTRQQLEGRIDRLDQTDNIMYIYYQHDQISKSPLTMGAMISKISDIQSMD